MRQDIKSLQDSAPISHYSNAIEEINELKEKNSDFNTVSLILIKG